PLEFLQATAGNRALVARLAQAGAHPALGQPGPVPVVQRRIATWLKASGGAGDQPAGGTPAFGVTTSLHGTAGKPLIDMPTVTPGRRIHVHLEPQLPLDMAEVSGWNVKDVAANAHLHIDNTRGELDAEDVGLFNTYAPGWSALTSYAGRRTVVWGRVPRQRLGNRLAQHQAEQQQRRQERRDAKVDKLRTTREAWIARRAGNDVARAQEFTIAQSFLAKGKKTQGPWKEAITAKLVKELTLPAGVTVTRVAPPQGNTARPIGLAVSFPSYRSYLAHHAEVASALAGLGREYARTGDPWREWADEQAGAHDDYLAEVANGDHDVALDLM
ncbi:MAG: hypothetical protein ACRDZW_10150, partial [Acidimicrobiales bacterium]